MAKLNLNTYPYYDDFTPDKNFHRVLFKPGYSVQARELTQLQSILQDQIKSFGDNIFKEGSVISGCPESTNFSVDVIKILDFNTFGVELDLDYLNLLEGKTLVGQNNGVRAVVKKVANGTEATSYKALFLQYVSQGTNGTSQTFEPDEVIELLNDATTNVVVADASEDPITKGSLFAVGDGIVYASGHFVRHYSQTIILEKFSETPNKKVGFLLTEDIVTSDDDETLLDPAQGAFNYTAPGADRYKLSTVLVAYPLNEAVEGFFILYEVEDGKISRRYDRTQYAELNRTLARRTYDESGDYVISPFNYHIREHLKTTDNDGVYPPAPEGDGDIGFIALGIEPGKAYVRGFEYELSATKYVTIEKPVATNNRTGIRLSTAYGNYVIVDEVCGNIPVNGSLVELRSGAAGAVTAGTFSDRAAQGTAIGTARISSIEYSSGTIGTATAKYRLYLYDIKMTGGSFNLVQGVYYNNGTKDFHADVATTPATLNETNLANYIVPTNYQFVKTLKPNTLDNSFVYKKYFTAVSVGTNGQFSISLSGTENFSFSTTSETTLKNEVVVIAETDIVQTSPSSTTEYLNGEIIPIDVTNIQAISATSITFQLAGTTYSSGATVSILAGVVRSDEVERTKTLQKDRYIRFQTTKTFDILTKSTTSQTYLEFDDVTGEAEGFDISNEDYGIGDKVYDENGNFIANVTGHTVANYGINRGARLTLDATVSVTSGKTITITHPSWSLGAKKFTSDPTIGVYDIWGISYIKTGDVDTPWADINTSGTNVTKSYKINNGQTEALYDLGTISGNFVPETRYVFKFSYFTHGTGAYFSVDSYPLPTQGDSATSTEIEWHQIPIFTAKNGVRYEMRNCLDFRNTVAIPAGNNPALSLTSATINPSGYTESTKAFTGFTPFFHPHPQEEFITDIEWNLPRVDRVILDADGNFTTVEGIAAESPIVPRSPASCMNLGVIYLPPYPALSPKSAKDALRPLTSARFTRTELQRRFTMADIGIIEKRLTNLEAYTKMSFMEQRTINTLIYDDNGDERFKNGVLVDSFEKADRVNMENPTNNCLITSGMLTARLDYETIDLEYATASNVYLKPNETSIVIRQSVSAGNFAIGETVRQGTTLAAGTLEHAVEIARGGNYKWLRLYLTSGSGSFIENLSSGYEVEGLTSGSSGKITYSSITENILETGMRPALISTPSIGEIATLPFVSQVYSENPYASEAISVTNNVVYGYEGDIGLIPAEDIWFEHRVLPVVNNYYNTEIVYQEKEIVKEIIVEKETKVETVIYVPHAPIEESTPPALPGGYRQPEAEVPPTTAPVEEAKAPTPVVCLKPPPVVIAREAEPEVPKVVPVPTTEAKEEKIIPIPIDPPLPVVIYFDPIPPVPSPEGPEVEPLPPDPLPPPEEEPPIVYNSGGGGGGGMADTRLADWWEGGAGPAGSSYGGGEYGGGGIGNYYYQNAI